MDQDELERLEHIVDRGRTTFVEVGQALAAIRDRRGYRVAGYGTFEAYLQERWGWSRQRGYQLIQASDVVADLAADEMSTPVDIPSEGHARALASLAPAERRSLLEQVGDLNRYSTRELYQAARQVKSEIRARPAVSRSREQNPGVSLRETEVMRDPDIRIEQGLAEHLPWADGEINLGITSPPYCLGEGVAYADGGDYDDYTLYGDQLVPAWCREFFRVTDPAGGRWCVNVPMDVAGHRRRDPKDRPLEPQPMYADWLQALLAAGFSYRTTILWHDDQAGAGTDRGTSNPSAPHVVAPVEAIIVVHRGAWKRVVETERRHDLDHEDWLQLCGPRGLWRFPGIHDSHHPAPFPEELPRRLINLYSWHEDVVGDPFVGRGTTAAVAARLGRHVRALDRAGPYVAMTQEWVARERRAVEKSVLVER